MGLDYDEAARELVRLGLVPAREDVEQADADGTVVAATPTGRLPVGTTVTLSVGVEPVEAAPVTTPTTPKDHGKPPKAHGPKPPKHGKPPKPPKHKGP